MCLPARPRPMLCLVAATFGLNDLKSAAVCLLHLQPAMRDPRCRAFGTCRRALSFPRRRALLCPSGSRCGPAQDNRCFQRDRVTWALLTPASSACAQGRVLRSGRPEITPDVQLYETFEYPRLGSARECGIHGTVGVPVYLREDSGCALLPQVSP